MSQSAVTPCWCNKLNKPHCCVIDCRDRTPQVDRCYPCHCSKGHERCLKTEQLRGDREKAARP